MGKGLFIVLEGLDGSGKSTQIALLEEKLKGLGRDVARTAEPTELPTGRLLRQALGSAEPVPAAQLAGLFLADRIAHNVDPDSGLAQALERGSDVISDRYYYSSFAYQGMDTDLKWVMDMNLNCPAVRKPDLCIFLDVDYRTCKERIDSRGERQEIFERSAATLAAIREKFLEVFRLLKGKENIRVVNADRPPEEVAEDVFELVKELL